jgi:hypothetical protein
VPPSLRLADLLAGLSVTASVGFGLPPEHAMRSCLMGTALGRAMGLDEQEVADTFYTTLLLHVGCTGLAHETVTAWGDDVALVGTVARTNMADPAEMAANLVPAIRIHAPRIRRPRRDADARRRPAAPAHVARAGRPEPSTSANAPTTQIGLKFSRPLPIPAPTAAFLAGTMDDREQGCSLSSASSSGPGRGAADTMFATQRP